MNITEKKIYLILPLYIEHCVKNKQIGNQLAHKGKKKIGL